MNRPTATYRIQFNPAFGFRVRFTLFIRLSCLTMESQGKGLFFGPFLKLSNRSM